MSDARARAAAEEIEKTLRECITGQYLDGFSIATTAMLEHVADAVAQAVEERGRAAAGENASCMEAEHGGHPTCPHVEEIIREQAEEIARLNREHANYILAEGVRVQAAVAAERERLSKWPHQCVMEACCVEQALRAAGEGASNG